MHKTFLKIFILLLNCFVIFGLPFLKPDLAYRQGQTNDLGINADSVDNDDGYPSLTPQIEDFIPSSYYERIPLWNSNFDDITGGTNNGDDDQELIATRPIDTDEDMIVKRPFENKFFGARGKRFFMPSRYTGWYSLYQPRPRKRYNPSMFVSMRGKRFDSKKYRSLEDYLAMSDDIHPEKRFHGFTALRGRRSIAS